jgi:hypothetical protein
MRSTIAIIVNISMVCPSLLSAHSKLKRPVLSMLEMRQAQTVKQGWDLSCGAAALSTVLTYEYKDAISEQEIIQALLLKTTPERMQKRHGFSLMDLKRFSVERGYAAEGYGKLAVSDLVGLRPAIVPISIGDMNHFIVFLGIERGHVLLIDPAFGNRTMTIDRFQNIWPLRIAFVVRRPDQVEKVSDSVFVRKHAPLVMPRVIRQNFIIGAH